MLSSKEAGPDPQSFPLTRDMLDRIFTNRTDDLYRFLGGIVKASPSLRDDVLQASYAKLAQQIADGKPPLVKDPLAFVRKVLENCVRDYHRSPAAQAEELGKELSLADPQVRAPFSEIVAREKLAKAQATLAQLEERSRTLLFQVDQEGVTLREAAATLGIPYSSAATLYRRAHKKLSDELGRHWSTFILSASSDDYAPRGRAAVLEAMEGLPKEHREVLRAKHLDRLSDKEAAARLGTTSSSIGDRLKHAEGLLEKKTGLTMAELLSALENRKGS